MRTLRFIVHAQAISRDPACDFGGLVAGSAGYLKAYFALDAAWKGCAVAASDLCTLRRLCTSLTTCSEVRP